MRTLLEFSTKNILTTLAVIPRYPAAAYNLNTRVGDGGSDPDLYNSSICAGTELHRGCDLYESRTVCSAAATEARNGFE